MKFDAKLIRTAALGFLAGAVIAGAAVFFTVSHLFRERIKLRPELRILAPGSLPPQIKPIEDKRVWD